MAGQWQFLEDDFEENGLFAGLENNSMSDTPPIPPANETRLGLVRYMYGDFASGSLLPEPDFTSLSTDWAQRQDIVHFSVSRAGLIKPGQLVLWRLRRRKDQPVPEPTIEKTHFALLNTQPGTGDLEVPIGGRFLRCRVEALADGDTKQPILFYSTLRWNYKLHWWMLSNAQSEGLDGIMGKICHHVFAAFGEEEGEERLRRLLQALRSSSLDYDASTLLRKAVAKLKPDSVNEAVRITQLCAEAGLGKQAFSIRFRPFFSPPQFVRWISGIDPRPVIFRTQMDVNEWKETLYCLDEPLLRLVVQRLEAEQPHSRPLAAALAILAQRG